MRIVLGVAVHVRQEILIHELRFDLIPLFSDATEEHAGEHAVAVKPVRVAAEVFVGDGIGAVPDILTAGEVQRDLSLVGACCQGKIGVDGSEVAGEITVDPINLLPTYM